LRREVSRALCATIPCSPGVSNRVPAQLRVLWSGFFDTQSALVEEYERDTRPTLVIVSSEGDEAAALRFLRPSDDVCAFNSPPAVFVERIGRLAALSQEIDRLRGFVLRDQLTGLPNRSALEAEFTRRASADTGRALHGLLMLDIDHFKSLNDRHGHAAGDQVIVTIAHRLREAAQSDDFVARIGGEEFAILMCRDDPASLVREAEAIRQCVGREPIGLGGADGHQASVTLSGGLCSCPEGSNVDEAVAKADAALYAAKAAGRNRLTTHDALVTDAAASGQDIKTRTFQNVTKVVTERVTNLITLFGAGLVEEAKREARTDPRTQLHNPRYFEERIAREIDLARKDGRSLSIALIDIDEFGKFNKDYGVTTANRVLRHFADIAAARVRSVDWLARYGGDEFVVVVQGTAEEARLVGERIRADLERAQVDTGDEKSGGTTVTVSIGVAQFTRDMRDADDLLKRASQALREAKRLGRNQVQVAT
jgi:diguanylate cyclase (GGDEF)-like protein